MLAPSPKKPCIMKHVYLHFDTESIRHVKRPRWWCWPGSLSVFIGHFGSLRFYFHIVTERPQPPYQYLRCLEQTHQTFTHFCAFQFSTPSKQTLFWPFLHKLHLCIVRLHCVFVDFKVDQGKSVIA